MNQNDNKLQPQSPWDGQAQTQEDLSLGGRGDLEASGITGETMKGVATTENTAHGLTM